MKNKIIAVLLAFAFLLNFARHYKLRAYADGMTAAMLGSVAYSIMQASGISFTAGNATAAGMESFMTGQIESYVNSKGGSLTSLFGGEMARLAAGKLVVGQEMYNGVLDFVDWLKEKYNLGTDDTNIGININGFWGDEINTEVGGSGVLSIRSSNYPGWWSEVNFSVYNNGVWKVGVSLRKPSGYTQVTLNGWSYEIVGVGSNNCKVIGYGTARGGYDSTKGEYTMFTPVTGEAFCTIKYSDSSTLDWSVPENWSAPAPLPQNKQWEGDYSGTPGFGEPPTDLPDFLSRVPKAIAENNLVVQEEIADTGGTPPTPSPNPSPSPSPAPYPGLSIAEKIALILGEITAIMFDTKGDTADQTYQDIGQEIEQTTQEIAESITEPITQTQTQTQQQIIDSTQTITQTITDTQTQTKEKLEDITQTITETQTQTQEKLEDVTQTIEDATSVPDQKSWDKVKKDLHGVFPFCIPWDIYGMLNAFNAEPRAPYFEYPFKIPSINLDYTLELDFKDFDPVAQTLRTVELIAFCVGLAILTSKVIRW